MSAHQLKEAFIRSRNNKYKDNRNLNTRAWDGPLLKHVIANGGAYTRSLEHTLSLVWNHLDPEDRNIETLDKFKTEIAKFLVLNDLKDRSGRALISFFPTNLLTIE